jgi:hypothetical protein
MASLKPLKGAAYDIAHHAQSGLSYLHPYIGQLCEEKGLIEASVNLLDSNPYPCELRRIDQLESSCIALQEKFKDILTKLNLPLSEVCGLHLKFSFSSSMDDYYTCSVESTLLKQDGAKFVQNVR